MRRDILWPEKKQQQTGKWKLPKKKQYKNRIIENCQYLHTHTHTECIAIVNIDRKTNIAPNKNGHRNGDERVWIQLSTKNEEKNNKKKKNDRRCKSNANLSARSVPHDAPHWSSVSSRR